MREELIAVKLTFIQKIMSVFTRTTRKSPMALDSLPPAESISLILLPFTLRSGVQPLSLS